MNISRFKFLILLFALIFNFTAKALFVEEAVTSGVKKIGEVAYYYVINPVFKISNYVINPVFKISTLAICFAENRLVNTKLKEKSGSSLYPSEELIKFNKKIESCIPFKGALKKLVLPLNMMLTSSPEKFFLNWFYYNFACPTLGKIFQQGKKIQVIKPMCTHLSYMFQGEGGGEEEKKLDNEIVVQYFSNELSNYCTSLNNFSKLFDEDKKTKKAPLDNILKGAIDLWHQSGSLKNKVYKQIILPFGSLFPIFYIFFTYSRFYQPTFQFLKNVPGLSHVYRYIEWMNNRWGWLKNELPKLKNVKVSSKFICFCAMLYFIRPTKLLKKIKNKKIDYYVTKT